MKMLNNYSETCFGLGECRQMLDFFMINMTLVTLTLKTKSFLYMFFFSCVYCAVPGPFLSPSEGYFF